MIEVWLAFVAGLAGSFHCIGMCGGIVAALAMTGKSRSLGFRMLSQLFYNLGRITTYSFLGAVAGLAGSSLDLIAVRSHSAWFVVAVNLFVVLIGLNSALGLSALSLSSLEGRGGRFFTAPLRFAVASDSFLAAFPLGVVLGFLPCGLVYAPLLAVATNGGSTLGAATMAALGLGTLPVMFLFGTASSAVSVTLRSAMVRVAGLAVAAMGVAGIWRAFARTCCG